MYHHRIVKTVRQYKEPVFSWRGWCGLRSSETSFLGWDVRWLSGEKRVKASSRGISINKAPVAQDSDIQETERRTVSPERREWRWMKCKMSVNRQVMVGVSAFILRAMRATESYWAEKWRNLLCVLKDCSDHYVLGCHITVYEIYTQVFYIQSYTQGPTAEDFQLRS